MIKFACGSVLFLGDAAATAFSSSSSSHGGILIAALGPVLVMVPEVIRWVDHFLEAGPADA